MGLVRESAYVETHLMGLEEAACSLSATPTSTLATVNLETTFAFTSTSFPPM